MPVSVDRHQKFIHWYRLLRSADMKNQFSKIKKNHELKSRPVRAKSEPAVIRMLLANTVVGHRRGTGHVGGRYHAVAVAWKSSPCHGSRHRTMEADTVEQMEEGRGLHACVAPCQSSRGTPPRRCLHELDADPW
jgi:hypothetical protein